MNRSIRWLRRAALVGAVAVASPALAGQAYLTALKDGASYDQFIVRFHDRSPEAADASARQRLLDVAGNAGGLKIRQLRRMAVGADVIKVNRKLGRLAAQQLLQRLAANPQVDYVEPDAWVQPQLTPNDTYYSNQWNYYETTAGIGLPAAWDKATGNGVVVAVIDTGITPHSDLSANIVAGYDFISDPATAGDGDGRDNNPNDEGTWTVADQCGVGEPATNSSWHGTHVAGTIAAVTNNAKGVAGVAFHAKVMPLRALGHCGGLISDISDAVVWAAGHAVSGVPTNANPAEVINMSLGSVSSCSPSEQSAINIAVTAGTVVVVAAGNDNIDAAGSSPANCDNVITVAAVGRTGARASYSNYGAKIDVSAPGGAGADPIASTMNTGTTTQGAETYNNLQGTSMAAPHVAGTVALMQSSKVNTPAAVEALLKQTARPLPVACPEGCGAGIIDASKAIPYTPSLSIADVSIVEGNSGTKQAVFTVSLSGTSVNTVTYSIATANSTATAGSDYVASTLTGQSIPAGQTTKTFTVTINGDVTVEANEAFFVNISAATGATIADSQAIGTILNDDGPTLSIANVAVTEGNSGTKLATFLVKLSVASGSPVSYNIATGNFTALAGSDYVAKTLTGEVIPAGQTSKTFTVTINGDVTVEPNELFVVNLSNAAGASIFDNQAIGTITDDDGPALSIADVSITEGNSGAKFANFTIKLSPVATGAVTYSIATADSTATTAGSDYVARTLTGQTIPAGQTGSTFSVTINGDITGEANEAFFVNLSSAVGANILDNQAVGTIVNDDLLPVVGITQISAGENHTCAVTIGGGVKCWGLNTYGQLGNGTNTPVSGGLTAVNELGQGVIAISAGFRHTCALTSGGGVKCWGLNDSGQLGDSSKVNRWTPVWVNGLSSGVIAIAAGSDHSCALISGGTVKCWGANNVGELGDGTTNIYLTPVTVSGLSGVSKIAAGWFHTCAIDGGTGLKCWGYNLFGTIGDGSNSNRWAPVVVSGLSSGIAEIAGGAEHNCAVTSGGAAVCWGRNDAGQLGDGTGTDRWAPVAVGGLSSGTTMISAGWGDSTCALVGGGVQCWGAGGVGQLGTGSIGLSKVPLPVSGLSSGVTQLTGGGNHNCALLSGGGVMCWGYNLYRQLGDGTTSDRWTPVNVLTY